MTSGEFSYRTRTQNLSRLASDVFDLLIIGGGITGAAVARDAASRGLKVALIERSDFAFGTSSRSSKLIHGGLRYLQNFELSLVFEALRERTFLLKTVPHLVRPLKFFMPVYSTDKRGMSLLSAGLWLYDTLSLMRTPGVHKRLNKAQLLAEFPAIENKNLKGGFQYFDASMWDDVLAIETLRSATELGAVVANYVEAVAPVWDGEFVTGFRVRDQEKKPGQGELIIKAKQVVSCVGPWTDQLGRLVSQSWGKWINPSKGVHLVFSLDRLNIPGAFVMSNNEDLRISFAIPRPDIGGGVVIVGTTDGPSPENPDLITVESAEVDYLMALLTQYFPSLKLTRDDIISTYVGVRPLMGAANSDKKTVLQKVSREHHIEMGPGGVVFVAGGKYTTHRTMAKEVVDHALHTWKSRLKDGNLGEFPKNLGRSNTKTPVNPLVSPEYLDDMRTRSQKLGLHITDQLLIRYGSAFFEMVEVDQKRKGESGPKGFEFIEDQLRMAIRREMVVRLSDFYFRRSGLFLALKDHGLSWLDRLLVVWAEELGDTSGRGAAKTEAEIEAERLRTIADIEQASIWGK